MKDDGFVKIYYNNELKSERVDFVTVDYDYIFIKYGIYNARDNFIAYPSNYEFPDQTIYFAGYGASNKRENLIINKIK